MPGYKGHLIGGTTTFFLVNHAVNKIPAHKPFTFDEFFFYFLLCLLGSLFPDIDTKSFGQKIFYILLALLIIFAIGSNRWPLLSMLSLVSLFPLLVNHRGIIHRVWFVIFVPLIIPIIVLHNYPKLAHSSFIAYAFFVAGALSHLALDYCSFQLIKKILFRK